MPTYQPNIPTGVVNLNVDYQNLRGNFQELDTVYLIDHVALTDGSAQKGYHKTVHLAAQGADPLAKASTGEVYSKTVNDGISTDESLYFQGSGGNIIQLTRNFLPQASVNGYTFLPGGIILQWGLKTGTWTTGSITSDVTLNSSNINFPNTIFAAWATPTTIAPPGALPGTTATIAVRSLSTSSIQFALRTSTSDPLRYDGYYWWAIGN